MLKIRSLSQIQNWLMFYRAVSFDFSAGQKLFASLLDKNNLQT